MITRDQIRAARALLDWSQPQLAELADVSTDLVSKIENGVTDGSIKTLRKIQTVLEDAGLEFLEHDGVKRHQSSVKEYRGQDGFIAFVRDVYETTKNGGQIYVSNVKESLFVEWEGEEAPHHMIRMSQIEGLDMKILVRDGDEFKPANYAEYKEIPHKLFGNMPYYIYGNKVAFIIFSEKNVDVYVIDHVSVARFFKQQFMNVWNYAS